MLLTFLSPSFGWQLVADHEQLAHGVSSADVVAHDHHHDHDHDTTVALDATPHDHDDPHAMIGHLLSHMPASLSAEPLPLEMRQHTAPPNDLPLRPLANLPSLPFRPPQTLLA